MEFQPGDQKNGIRGAGGLSGVPSIEKDSAESGSSGVFGSEISMLTSTAVRPLSRCGGRGIGRRCEFGQRLRQSCKHIVQVLPAFRLQPAPACKNFIVWCKNLEESLGASFAADECAIGFGKSPGGQLQLRLFGGRVGQVIEDDYVFGGAEKSVHFGRRRTAIEIILQDDHCVGASIPDGVKGGGEWRSADQSRSHGVAFRRG